MTTKTDIYLSLVILTPLVIVILSWVLLNPSTFWQRLVMVFFSVIEFIVVATITIGVLEAIDK